MDVDSHPTASRAVTAPGHRGLPRAVDATLALVGLVVTAPALLAALAVVRLTSPGSALFRQQRVGRWGRAFTMYKVRTMRHDAGGPGVTASDDHRVTAVGRVLRLLKLDELPELVNVVRGDMTVVGPRPEVPDLVDPSDPLWQAVLAAAPGLTHPVTVALRHEERLMAAVDGDRHRFYVDVLQRYKLLGYCAYEERRTWLSDVKVIVATVAAVALPGLYPAPSVAEVERAVRDAARDPVPPRDAEVG